MSHHYANGTTYADFARDFTTAEFDPNEFAETIKASGARYFVLTSKHHEGYTLWPSSTSFNWNSVDVGPHRDLVADLSKAIRDRDIHFGLYFSQMTWFHPLYLADKKDKTANYPTQVSIPQMHEIVNRYKPDILWSDGDWEQTAEYWQSQQFLAWLFNDR
ncbi:Alpha-L-fucosidase [Aphelenchoides besseyi]|nr:Alpha-L-fucosidase [Aphelenchoides besseyi]